MKLVVPELKDMWFREKLLSDAATMSYNKKWGGTISFPEERWHDWYRRWVTNAENDRFYRYLADKKGAFVGEVAYHWDEDTHAYLADVVIMAQYRGNGYGTGALKLLCEAAKRNGLKALHDTIAVDNPSLSIFIKEGFREEYRTEEYIMVKKNL